MHINLIDDLYCLSGVLIQPTMFMLWVDLEPVYNNHAPCVLSLSLNIANFLNHLKTDIRLQCNSDCQGVVCLIMSSEVLMCDSERVIYELAFDCLGLCKGFCNQFLRHNSKHSCRFNWDHSDVNEVVKNYTRCLRILEEVELGTVIVSVSLGKVGTSQEDYISDICCERRVFLLRL